MMKNGLCIIPARAGSKRFPGKNLATLGGRSLVQLALDSAVDSNLFRKIYLSSDDEAILAQTEQYQDLVCALRRDPKLAQDTTKALEVVCQIVSDYPGDYDFVSLLLPTAPLRTSKHLQEGMALLDRHPEADGVVSLTTYEFPPQLSVTLESGAISPVFDPCPLITGNTRSQDQEMIYRPNGAFYFHRFPAFEKHQNFWKGRVLGYVMDRLESVDIDNPFDLAYAEFLLKRVTNQ